MLLIYLNVFVCMFSFGDDANVDSKDSHTARGGHVQFVR